MKIEIGVFKSAADGSVDVGVKLELGRTSEIDETKLAQILQTDLSNIRGKIFKFYQDNGQKTKYLSSRGGLI